MLRRNLFHLLVVLAPISPSAQRDDLLVRIPVKVVEGGHADHNIAG